MDNQEIAMLSMWTARTIYDALKQYGVNLSAVEENLIANFVRRMLEDWNSGAVIDTKHMLKLVSKLKMPNNQPLSQDVVKVLRVFVEKFPQFVAANSDSVKV